MDRTWSHSLGGILVRLQARRAEIQSRTEAKLRLGRVWIHGLAFFTLSVLFGWAAYEWSNEQWRISWLEQRRPSQDVWETALRSKRYLKVDNREWQWAFQRAFNPTLLDQSDVWISSDRLWVAIHPDRNSGEPEIWSPLNVTKKTPIQTIEGKTWEALGRGWVGFEVLLERIQNPPTAPSPPKLTRPGYRDPREIRY